MAIEEIEITIEYIVRYMITLANMIEKYNAHITIRETFWEWLKLLRNLKVSHFKI